MHYKNTLADKIKVIDDKIKDNEDQCNLDGKAAKMIALPTGKLDKYEYLTGKYLAPKSRPIHQM